jgi:hypothetical protein
MSGAVLAGGASTSVEAGAYFDFVAPDPVAPADGAIRFGFDGSPETIAADAELVPPADTNLAFLGGGSPTCVEVAREGGVITRLAFVGACTVSGSVVFVDDLFGPGGDAYLIGGRLAAPAVLVDGEPPFAALIGAPAATGATLEITFQIDLATGIPTAFVGVTTVSGPVVVLGNGDVAVGSATLPSAIIDDAARALLAEAAELGVEATVGITGNGTFGEKGEPALDIVLAVSFTAPTPGATPEPPAPAPSADALPDTGVPGTTASIPGGVALIALAFALAVFGRSRTVRRRSDATSVV